MAETGHGREGGAEMSSRSGYQRKPIPGFDTWVRAGDLTDEMVNDITRAQRRDAARRGELAEYDRDYAARMRAMKRDARLYG
jgi:hypothetical protein